MAARPPVSPAQRQRYRAIYKLMLNYYDQKQRAHLAQDVLPPHASPMTGPRQL